MSAKDTFFSKKQTINCRGKLVDLSKPLIMGILNITPDSFFDGNKYTDKNLILKRAQQIIDEGADIIDIGAFSSRPGAKEISFKEEFDRLKSVLSIVRNKFPEIIISIDTYRSEIAKLMIQDLKLILLHQHQMDEHQK